LEVSFAALSEYATQLAEAGILDIIGDDENGRAAGRGVK
jgi:hypothetical protein